MKARFVTACFESNSFHLCKMLRYTLRRHTPVESGKLKAFQLASRKCEDIGASFSAYISESYYVLILYTSVCQIISWDAIFTVVVCPTKECPTIRFQISSGHPVSSSPNSKLLAVFKSNYITVRFNYWSNHKEKIKKSNFSRIRYHIFFFHFYLYNSQLNCLKVIFTPTNTGKTSFFIREIPIKSKREGERDLKKNTV